MRLSRLLLLALLLNTFHHACNQNGGKTGAAATTNASQSATTAENPRPDGNDLLQLLQGRWQSTDDATYVIEFNGATMRHLNNGQLSYEVKIEVDATCQTTACAAGKGGAGWCFQEKGDQDVQCNLVLKADNDVLQYSAIGAAGSGDHAFTKIKG